MSFRLFWIKLFVVIYSFQYFFQEGLETIYKKLPPLIQLNIHNLETHFK